ncbi:hypothetical protein PAPYR_3665 [Paratrimastix pyriformis]|uniref:F-box domain-containing protein n=1 Tax=Paratrimastix pyriformis TaxID=342808 RepID=A0ABQ8UP95_9EUKA|nr:hypothetical protein PAPYR_3665 [Paratrimastix pyriformis]
MEIIFRHVLSSKHNLSLTTYYNLLQVSRSFRQMTIDHWHRFDFHNWTSLVSPSVTSAICKRSGAQITEFVCEPLSPAISDASVRKICRLCPNLEVLRLSLIPMPGFPFDPAAPFPDQPLGEGEEGAGSGLTEGALLAIAEFSHNLRVLTISAAVMLESDDDATERQHRILARADPAAVAPPRYDPNQVLEDLVADPALRDFIRVSSVYQLGLGCPKLEALLVDFQPVQDEDQPEGGDDEGEQDDTNMVDMLGIVLAQAALHQPTLRSLRFRGESLEFTDDGFQIFYRSLSGLDGRRGCIPLREVGISSSEALTLADDALLALMAHASHLTCLDFAGCSELTALKLLPPWPLIPRGASSEPLPPEVLPELVSLDLSGTKLSDADLLLALSKAPALRRLSLGYCHQLTAEGMAAAFRAARCRETLERIDLSDTKATGATLEALLTGAGALRTVLLALCKRLGDAEGIETPTRTLRQLVLDGSSLTDQGLARLVHACPGLHSLSLTSCEALSGLGLGAVAALHELRVLDGSGLMTDEALTAIYRDGANPFPHLEVLCINGCSLTDATFNILSQARLLRTLLQLHCSGCEELTDASMQALFQEPDEIPLTVLNLAGCVGMTLAVVETVTRNPPPPLRSLSLSLISGTMTGARMHTLATRLPQLAELDLTCLDGMDDEDVAREIKLLPRDCQVLRELQGEEEDEEEDEGPQ